MFCNVIWAPMDFNKQLLLCFLYLHAFVSNLVYSSNLQKYEPYNLKNGDDDCICTSLSSQVVTAPKILDPNNKDIERLVVYVYRIKNGTTYVYIPNKRKQVKIPDLPQENGDKIQKISKELLYTIFTDSDKIWNYYWDTETDTSLEKDDISYPSDINNKDPSKPKNHTGQGIITIDVPTDSNSGELSSELDPNSSFNTYEYITRPLKPKPNKTDTDIASDSNSGEEDDVYKPYQIPDVSNNDNNSKLDNVDKIPDINDDSKPISPNKPDDNNKSEDDKTSENNLPQGQSPSIVKEKPRQPAQGKYPNIFNAKDFGDWLDGEIKAIKLENGIPTENIDSGPLQILILNALKINGIRVKPNGDLEDSEGNTFNITNLHLRPVLIGNSLDYNKVMSSPNRSSLALTEHAPYFKTLLIALLNPPRIITILPLGKVYFPRKLKAKQVPSDIVVMREHIKNLPSQHNKVLPKLESKENALLEIIKRPSKPVPNKPSYEIVTTRRNKGKKKSNKPTINKFTFKVQTSPKLHTIVQSKPKLIPTRKNFKPDSDKKQPNFKNDLLQNLAQLIRHKHPDIPEANLIEILQNIIGKYKKDSSHEVIVHDIYKKVKSNKINLGETWQDNGPQIKKKYKTYSKHVPVGKHLAIKKKHRLPPPPPIVELDYSDTSSDFEGNPDFRIIGGAAATGSGSPLNNRGRAGVRN